jgi:hypothetical protein
MEKQMKNKNIEALLRGYLFFNVNGKRFFKYNSAVKSRKSTPKNKSVIFKGWNIFYFFLNNPWRSFYERVIFPKIKKDRNFNSMNDCIVNGSIDFDVEGFDNKGNTLISGNLKDLNKGNINQLVKIYDKKTKKLVTSFIFHVTKNGNCCISHKGDYIFINKDCAFI